MASVGGGSKTRSAAGVAADPIKALTREADRLDAEIKRRTPVQPSIYSGVKMDKLCRDNGPYYEMVTKARQALMAGDTTTARDYLNEVKRTLTVNEYSCIQPNRQRVEREITARKTPAPQQVASPSFQPTKAAVTPRPEHLRQGPSINDQQAVAKLPMPYDIQAEEFGTLPPRIVKDGENYFLVENYALRPIKFTILGKITIVGKIGGFRNTLVKQVIPFDEFAREIFPKKGQNPPNREYLKYLNSDVDPQENFLAS